MSMTRTCDRCRGTSVSVRSCLGSYSYSCSYSYSYFWSYSLHALRSGQNRRVTSLSMPVFEDAGGFVRGVFPRLGGVRQVLANVTVRCLL